MIGLNINQIRYFLVTARYLSFTKAASHHFITQPALSRQIAAMEAELGIPLFIREKNSVKLTDPGKVLYEGLADVMRQYEQCVERAVAANCGNKGSLRIGKTNIFTFDDIISKEISKFIKDNPLVEISVPNMSPSQLIGAVRNGEVDIGFTFFDYAVERSIRDEFEFIVVGNEKVYIAISEIHAKSAIKDLSIKDLKTDVLVAMDVPKNQQMNYDQNNLSKQMYLRDNDNPRIKYVTDLETLMTIVESGGGFTVVPYGHVICRSPLIRLVEMPEHPGLDKVGFWYGDNTNPVLQVFLKLLSHINT